jgi:intron-binding protein aquarius
MKPWLHESGDENTVVWGGWARMALPISGAKIVSVSKPLVGETAPAEVKIIYKHLFSNKILLKVKADILISLPKRQDIRDEWQSIRKNDVLFLLKVIPRHHVGYKFDPRLPFKSQFEISAVILINFFKYLENLGSWL